MEVGDRFFLAIQGKYWAGIMAQGQITTRWHWGKHWDVEKAKAGMRARYVKVIFTELRNPLSQSFIERDKVRHLKALNGVRWGSNSSGTSIPQIAVAELDRLWGLLNRGIKSPEKVPVFNRVIDEIRPERVSLTTVRFTRSRSYADQVKEAYGFQCQRCREIVRLRRGCYAEAVHLRPIKLGGSDGPTNMLCLCPNCHKSLDGGGFQLRIDELVFRPGHKLDLANVDFYNRTIFMGLK